MDCPSDRERAKPAHDQGGIERAPRHGGRKSGPSGQGKEIGVEKTSHNLKQPKFPQKISTQAHARRQYATREDATSDTSTRVKTICNARRRNIQHSPRVRNTQAPDSAHYPILKPACLQPVSNASEYVFEYMNPSYYVSLYRLISLLETSEYKNPPPGRCAMGPHCTEDGWRFLPSESGPLPQS